MQRRILEVFCAGFELGCDGLLRVVWSHYVRVPAGVRTASELDSARHVQRLELSVEFNGCCGSPSYHGLREAVLLFCRRQSRGDGGSEIVPHMCLREIGAFCRCEYR